MEVAETPPIDPPQTRVGLSTPEHSKANSLRLLALGFGLTFIHLFWYGSPWTAWLAVCCYSPFIIWLQVYSKKPFRAGWLFGLFYGVMNETWLGQFAAKYTGVAFVGFLMVFIIAGVWGCFYGLACLLRKKFTFLQNPILFSLLFFAMEFCRMNVPQLEYPNCPIGEPLIVYPVLASGLISAYFCMFFVLICNSLIATFASKPIHLSPYTTISFRPIALLAICFAPIMLIGFVKGRSPAKKIGVRVALGQLGTDLAYSEEGMKPFLIEAAANDLSQRAIQQKADVIFFPEGVAHFDITPKTDFKLLPNLPAVFGAQHGRSPTYQAAYLWNGTTFSHTDKRQLVVMGEYVPFRNILPYPETLKLPSGDLRNGTERHLLEVKPGIKAGVMICYESMFWRTSQEFAEMNADFLSIISLDDWYMGTNGIPRLEICARWRAVETEKWIVRVGSLGKTMIIDPQGRVKAEIPTGTRQLLVYDL
jgi:apolipoprotein N-acyltransferase